eukprot:CAMPEP_0114973070 /NCGR_PEP_ID=MMETSP0216-20121206/750_1 /TAXON_ID=223996 /ORGANISM="Protocruzia adherens, Strain Boccale" /LENGTH=558 /DNA_ID=CAMNT_0002333521 /DNA_START=480 /DNA_END=2156 /DNA_ORIENTATION=+
MSTVLQEVFGVQSNDLSLIGLGNISEYTINHTDQHSVFEGMTGIFDNGNNIGSFLSHVDKISSGSVREFDGIDGTFGTDKIRNMRNSSSRSGTQIENLRSGGHMDNPNDDLDNNGPQLEHKNTSEDFKSILGTWGINVEKEDSKAEEESSDEELDIHQVLQRRKSDYKIKVNDQLLPDDEVFLPGNNDDEPNEAADLHWSNVAVSTTPGGLPNFKPLPFEMLNRSFDSYQMGGGDDDMSPQIGDAFSEGVAPKRSKSDFEYEQDKIRELTQNQLINFIWQGNRNRLQSKQRKEKYSVTDNDTRMELITLIERKNLTIKKAAEQLGLNYSTAKSVVQMYKKEGRILKKSIRKKRSLKGGSSESPYLSSVDGNSDCSNNSFDGRPSDTSSKPDDDRSLRSMQRMFQRADLGRARSHEGLEIAATNAGRIRVNSPSPFKRADTGGGVTFNDYTNSGGGGNSGGCGFPDSNEHDDFMSEMTKDSGYQGEADEAMNWNHQEADNLFQDPENFDKTIPSHEGGGGVGPGRGGRSGGGGGGNPNQMTRGDEFGLGEYFSGDHFLQ